MSHRQCKVHISNLPNTTPREHILQYLETAGPIKDYNFDESGQRCKFDLIVVSATVVYFDIESAETAKKYLDQKEFNTRKIKIMIVQPNREIKVDFNYGIKSKIGNMKKQDKTMLFRYLKGLKEQEGEMFTEFVQAHPWLVEELLKF